MPADPHQHVGLVTRLPREQWADAYPILVRVCRRYEPARGPLDHLFAVAWRHRRCDLARRAASRARLRCVPFDERFAAPAPAPRETQLPPLPRCKPLETAWACVRTGSYEAAARLLGVPIGTVKSRMHRLRVMLGAR